MNRSLELERFFSPYGNQCLSSSGLLAGTYEPFGDEQKRLLVAHYKDITKFAEKDILKLPLACIEVILSSDDLQVESEDTVYDIVLKWARTHYPNPEERREILKSRLACLIRFPYMTYPKLKEVLTCNDFDRDLARKVVLEALFFKAEDPDEHCMLTGADDPSSNNRFVERMYKFYPVKVIHADCCHRQCVVRLELHREKCLDSFPSERLISHDFYFCGQYFFLSTKWATDNQNSTNYFAVLLHMRGNGSVALPLDCSFAVRSKLSRQYSIARNDRRVLREGKKAVLLVIPSNAVAAQDSDYFFNDVFHFKVSISLYISGSNFDQSKYTLLKNKEANNKEHDLVSKENGQQCSEVLNLPNLIQDPCPSVPVADGDPPSPDAEKYFLATLFRDTTESRNKVMKLPLARIKEILLSNNLEVASENDVYDFVLKWARAHYPNLEERREILTSHLAPLIRFPYMTHAKLKDFFTCEDFDRDLALEVLLEALFFKAMISCKEWNLPAQGSSLFSSSRFVPRALPKPVENHLSMGRRPVEHSSNMGTMWTRNSEICVHYCVIYLDLKRKECASLFPRGRSRTQVIYLGGHQLDLKAICTKYNSRYCFGLLVGLLKGLGAADSFEFQFAFDTRSRSTGDYTFRGRQSFALTEGSSVGFGDLFGIPWDSFMAEDSLHFIDDVLHIRAVISVRH